MNRRKFFSQSVGLLAPAMSFPFININKYKIFHFSDQKYSTRAIDLIKESVVVDMLNQFSFPGKELNGWFNQPETFKESIQKYIDSGIDVFALGHSQRTRTRSLDYFTQWNKMLSANRRYLHRIDKAEDLNYVSRSGKIGVLLSFQDSRHFESPEDVDLFYAMGQRISQLTYNYKNQIGSGGFDDQDNGLSEFGKQIVERMNQSGMAIDLSHCSDRSTLEGIELSTGPVLITHANCRGLNPGHPRAKTDEMIKKLADKGGIFGVAEIRFMVRDKEPVTIEHFLDHYDYLIKLVGVEHVGIGTDFDLDTDDGRLSFDERKKMLTDSTGERYKKYRMHSNEKYLVGIEGINHPKRIFDIVEGFIRRGYSNDTIKLILGGNFTRVVKAIWK